jgi:hypothetical protein
MKTNNAFSNHAWRLTTAWAAQKLLPVLLLLILPGVAQAQFYYATTDSRITITGYAGPGGAVTVPATINGLPVVGVGDETFSSCSAWVASPSPPASAASGRVRFHPPSRSMPSRSPFSPMPGATTIWR